MKREPLENLNIAALDLMPPPDEIHARVPVTEAGSETVTKGRDQLRQLRDEVLRVRLLAQRQQDALLALAAIEVRR